MTSTIKCHRLTKIYGIDELSEPVLHGVDLDIKAGESCILLGPSGSGKTTLLSIIGCLSTPTTGGLEVLGKAVNFDDNLDCVRIRRQNLGFVFQNSRLLPFLSVEQNIILTAQNAGLSFSEAKHRAQELFYQLHINNTIHKKPGLLSGGQKQRVAITRALIHKPNIVLADEPTAALDWRNAQTAIDLLIEQTRSVGASLIVVCHDSRLVQRFDRIFSIDNGQVVETS